MRSPIERRFRRGCVVCDIILQVLCDWNGLVPNALEQSSVRFDAFRNGRSRRAHGALPCLDR